MKTYPIVCPSCKGAGYIDSPYRVSGSAVETCPACNGSKIIICINYDLEPITIISNKVEGYKSDKEPILSKGLYDLKDIMKINNIDRIIDGIATLIRNQSDDSIYHFHSGKSPYKSDNYKARLIIYKE
jgi:hypothetical protein